MSMNTYESMIVAEENLIEKDGSYRFPDGTFCVRKVDSINGSDVDFNCFMMNIALHSYTNTNAVVNPGDYYYDLDGNLHIHPGHRATLVGQEIKFLKSGDIDLPAGINKIYRYSLNKETIVKDASGNTIFSTTPVGDEAKEIVYNLASAAKLVSYGFATIVSGSGGSGDLEDRVNSIENNYLDSQG